MKRKNSEALRDVLLRYLREQGLETPIYEHRAVSMWPEVAGPTITRYTGDVKFQHGKLFIKITNPALRQDLNMGRFRLVHRINERVGANIVDQIVFY